MKISPEQCETCNQIGGYIYCICHEQKTDAGPIHESICGGCLANRIEKHFPKKKRLIAYYRAKND